MPTHIFEPFSTEELSQTTLADPFPFTKGAKLLKVPVIERSPMYSLYGPGAFIESDTRLYDLRVDPGQETPIHDGEVAAKLDQLMTELMTANHAPPEAYTRLGFGRDAAPGSPAPAAAE